METPAWRQKTIEDAIRDGRKGKHVAAQYHLLKCVALERPNIEHKLLVKLMLHAGLDKIDDPVWTLPDDDVMEWVKCKRAAFLNALGACRDDYLLSYSGPPSGRRYKICHSNLVDRMSVEHQIKFYEILGYEREQIRLFIGATAPPTIPPGGKDFHLMETSSTTWNRVPFNGTEFHLMESPNKEEEQLKEQVEEQPKEQIQEPGEYAPSKSPRAIAATSTALTEDIQIPDALAGETFAAAWSEWLAYRRERRLICRARTISRQLQDLAPLGPTQAAACLQLSIRNGWQGMFPERFVATKTMQGVNYDPNAIGGDI